MYVLYVFLWLDCQFQICLFDYKLLYWAKNNHFELQSRVAQLNTEDVHTTCFRPFTAQKNVKENGFHILHVVLVLAVQ